MQENPSIQPTEDPSKAKKKLEIRNFLAKGTYLDAKDSMSNWCVAMIEKSPGPDSEILHVRFDGWTTRWNENYKITSSKIAPFRKFSRGYTGQPKQAMRDWSFSVEELEKCKENLERILEKNFEDLGVFNITQIFRGSYYVFIDCLLGNSAPEIRTKEVLEQVFASLRLQLRLAVQYMKKLPSLFNDFQKGTTNNEAFLVEENVALAHCMFEILENVGKIFGNLERTQKLYRENASLILTMPQLQNSEKKWVAESLKSSPDEMDSWLKSQQTEKAFRIIVSHMINYFGDLGGFAEIISLLTIDESKPLIPIKIMETLFQLLRTILDTLNEDIKGELVKVLRTALEKRFSLLTEKEIKDFDKELASNFINDSKTLFLQYLPEESVHKLLEGLELDLALKYLKSPFFEKRLKGVNEIKDISERIEYTENNQSVDNYYYHVSRRKQMKYLTSEIFLKWISENKIVEILLGDSMHVEIIKRCHDILIFMCKHKYMPSDIINHIWKAGEGKHDSLVRGLYEMIIEISAYLSADSLKLLYEKIKEIPLSSYVELTLNLVKGFTDNVIKSNFVSLKYSNLREPSQDDKPIEEQYLGIELLWKTVLDSSPLANNLIEMAVGHIKSISHQMNAGILRSHFMNKCLSEIKNGTSIPQSLTIAINILQYYNNYKDMDSSHSKIMNSLKNQYDLINTLIKDLRRYKDVVKQALGNAKPTATSYLEAVYEGKFSHKINLEKRLKMIELLVSSDPNLHNEHLEDLWVLFIKQANHEADRRIYCSWLMKKNEDDTPGEINVFLPSKNHIFHQFRVFCNKNYTDYIGLLEEEFECFTYLFKLVNHYENKIKLSKNGKFSINDFDLTGKSDLWDIFLNSGSPKIVECAIDLLVDLHLQFSTNFEKKKKREIQDDFTVKCINLLKQSFSNQNFGLLNKAISLIMSFFDKFEGKPAPIKSQKPSSMSTHLFPVTVQLKPEDTKKDMKISFTETLGSFKKKISEEFHIPFRAFTFVNKSNSSDYNDPNEDDSLLRDHGWTSLFIIMRKPKKPEDGNEENYHPKKLISDSPEYLDLLFMLLSNPNSGCLNIIWELLMKLPVNEKIKESLFKVERKWEDLFDENSLYKSLYCLQIIEEFILSSSRGQEGKAWENKMQKSNALSFFLEVYGKQSFENYTNLISKKYIASLLKVINNFSSLWKFPENYLKNKDKLRKFAVKLLDTIAKISEYTLLREKQNLENCQYEKTQYNQQLSEKQNDEVVRMPEFFITEAEIVNVCLDLLLSLMEHCPELVETIYGYPNLEQLISVGLIQTDNFVLKKKMADGLIELFDENSKNNQISVSAQEFFLPILWGKFFKFALEHGNQSEIYFELLQKNIESLPKHSKTSHKKSNAPSVNLEEMLSQLVELIKIQSFLEKNHTDRDNILIGLLNLISSLLQKLPEKAFEVGQTKGLLQELLGPCLFETPRKSIKNNAYPKCKGYFSRCAAFNLIQVLASGSTTNLRVVLDYLAPLHLKADWRTKSISDWNITPKINEKSATGYVGLKNLGCICYMNSLMQQFYMIPSFRRDIMEVEDRNFDKVPKEDNMLYQLKCLFLALTESEKQYYNPKNFCQAFKDWEGNPTNVYEQRDVDEFFNMFLDRLENSIKGSKKENIIKKHFGGVSSNELICKGCPHYSEREENFLAVSLQVKNKKTIQESLASFVEGEMLEGDNAYLCEICDKKVPTLKRVCLKRLPNHMILVLKRFEFDFDNMSKVKVNDSCEFPMNINFEPFTQQGLRKAERKKAQNQGSEPPEFEDEYDQKYFEYRLKGIVIHLGIADSGHYYSLIQERGNEGSMGTPIWYEFNDTIVKTFDEKDIPDEAFGGEEKWSYYNMSNIKEKIKNAYILFYERVVPISEESLEKVNELKKEESKEVETVAETSVSDSKNLEVAKNNEKNELKSQQNSFEEFLQEILKDNLKFHIHKNIFSMEYFNFVTELISKRQFEDNNDYIEFPFVYDEKKYPQKHYDLECLKLGVLFLLTCVFRERERQNNATFLPFLKKQLARNLPACLWVLSSFSNRQIIDEFILSCLEKNIRDFTCGILRLCMRRVYSEEAESSRNRLNTLDVRESPTTILANFINIFINLIFDCRSTTRDYTEFFQIFYYFAKLGPECAHYLIKKKLIGRLMDFFFNVREYHEVFRKFPDVKFKETDPSLLGHPAEVKKKILSTFEELRQKKKEKFLMDNYNSSSRIYLWQTVAELLLYCRLQKNEKPCKWQHPGADCDLLPEERTFLKQETENAYRVLLDVSNKIAVRSTTLIFTYVSYEDQKFSESLIGIVRKGLIEKNTVDYRVFFALIKRMLSLEDSLMDMRAEKIIVVYTKCMQENFKYYSEFVCLQEFLLKIASRFPKLRNVLTKNPDLSSWIIEYIRAKELASGYISENLKSRANRFLPLNRFANPKTFQDYKEYCEKKITKFKKMAKGEIEHETVDWDSDDDLSEYAFKPDDKFDYYYQNLGKWVTGQVKSVVEEVIQAKLSYNEVVYNPNISISRKSEFLAPYLSMQEPIEIKEKNGGDGESKERIKGKKSGEMMGPGAP